MTYGEFYHHFTLYCDARAICELSLHALTCLASLYMYAGKHVDGANKEL